MLKPENVTACLITRGDVDLDPILETLPYPVIIIWGPEDPELHVHGRYAAIGQARTRVIYTQDDDCIFTGHDDLLAAYEPGRIVAVNGHGENDGGYGDVALVHGGAIMDRDLPQRAFAEYLLRYPYDEGYLREADMINGTITPSRQLDLPYEIRMEIATAPNRMCNQPWQADLKRKITDQARQVRDLLPACVYCGDAVTDGTDEHEHCVTASLEAAL